jgi:hypothetical protein
MVAKKGKLRCLHTPTGSHASGSDVLQTIGAKQSDRNV